MHKKKKKMFIFYLLFIFVYFVVPRAGHWAPPVPPERPRPAPPSVARTLVAVGIYSVVRIVKQESNCNFVTANL